MDAASVAAQAVLAKTMPIGVPFYRPQKNPLIVPSVSADGFSGFDIFSIRTRHVACVREQKPT